MNNNWNLDPHESYLNQVPPGATQYPADSMFAVGKPHGEAAAYHAPQKVRKPRTVLDMVMDAIKLTLASLAAAFVYIEATARARRYNAIPEDVQGGGGKLRDGILVYHYPWSWDSLALQRWNKFWWCLFAAIIPALLYTTAIVISVGMFFSMPFLTGKGALPEWMEDSGLGLILGVFSLFAGFIFSFFYQLSKANKDTEDDWQELRRMAKQSPIRWVPITNHDAKLLGWNSLQEYRQNCLNIVGTLCPEGSFFENKTFLEGQLKIAKMGIYPVAPVSQLEVAIDARDWKKLDDQLNIGYRLQLAENQPLPTLCECVKSLVSNFVHGG